MGRDFTGSGTRGPRPAGVTRRDVQFGLLAGGATAFAGPAGAAGGPGATKASDFGELPLVESPRLSPNGTYLAVVQRIDDRPVLSIYPLAGGKPFVTQHRDAEIRGHVWANDNRIVIKLAAALDRDGIPTTETRLVAVNADGTDFRLLTDNRFASGGYVGQIQSNIVSMLPDDPDHILLALDHDGNLKYSVYKMNIYTGRSTVAQAAVGDSFDWVADADGEVRFRIDWDYRKDERYYFVRIKGASDWKPVGRDETGTRVLFTPFAFLRSNPNQMYVSARRNSDKSSYFIYDLLEDKFVTEVFSHRQVDAAGLLLAPKDERLLAVNYILDAPEMKLVDPSFARIVETMASAFPGETIVCETMTRDERLVGFRVESPTRPPEYYVYDTTREKALRVGRAYPNLPPDALSPVRPYPYAARDGLAIPAYLTQPRGKGDKGLPLVVMPHGGPAARDFVQFDWWAQFLASRGYAVLQPNFRGSSGYGGRFGDMSEGQWGLSMQDDLEDGVRKLVADGIADPARIAIVGASYGGYAALMGVVRTPDLYRAAVSVAGIGDLFKLLNEADAYTSVGYWKKELGSRWQDRDRLETSSPRRQVDKIKAPVLLLHGTKDRVVSVSQSKSMASALRSAGKEHELILLEDGDHYLTNRTHRTAVLEATERFLARHLAG